MKQNSYPTIGFALTSDDDLRLKRDIRIEAARRGLTLSEYARMCLAAGHEALTSKARQ